MQLSVSGKHIDVGDSLRGHVTTAISTSAGRYFGRAIEGKVVFQRARHAYRADISLHVARGITVQSHGEAADPYLAFDTAAERLDKRLRRHKRWLVDRRKEKDAAGPAPESAAHFVFTDDASEAADVPPAAADSGEDRDHGKSAVVADAPVAVEMLSVGDAVARLDLADLPVLLFRNNAHGGYNVVYRRPDGMIGWIDPPASASGAGAATTDR